MGSEWREIGLNDLGEVARGRSRHRPRYAEHLYGGTYPFIQTGDVKASGGIIDSHSQTYSEAGLAQSRLWPANTMCITIAANIAETGILSYPACFPDSVIGFIANENNCDVRFIEYRFRYLKAQLQREAIGSVQDNINLATFERLKFSIPKVPEQKRIAHILGSLDSKIQLNRQTNQTLEQMAQALFKSWFVDFDPVIDNALAAGNPIPPELEQKAAQRAQVRAAAKVSQAKPGAHPHDRTRELPQHLRELFPSEFEQIEELGWIPKGWEISELDELISVKHGYAFKGEFFCDNTTENVLLTPGNVTIGGGFKGRKFKYYNGPVMDDYIFSKGDVYINMTDLSKAGDTLGCPAFVPEIEGTTFHHNQRLGRVEFKNIDKIGPQFIYRCLCSREYRNHILATATGTTVKHTSPTKILKYRVVNSGGVIETVFEKISEKLTGKMELNNSSSRNLSKIRDTLLPKLISGELRLP